MQISTPRPGEATTSKRRVMAGESTFDVVSKVDKQEVANALNQAQKELAQRYDFKGVGAEVDFSGEKILMKANSEERVLARSEEHTSELQSRLHLVCRLLL